MFTETNSRSEPPIVKPRSPWNRGKLIGQKPPLASGGLVNPHSSPAERAIARSCDVQPGNRQQASRLRSRCVTGRRCAAGRARPAASRGHAEENRASCPVRDNRTDARDSPAMDQAEQSRTWPISISEPDRKEQAAHHPALRASHEPMDRVDRPGSRIVWHALATPNEGRPDLSADRKSSRGPASAWAHQAGKHGPLSRDRGRRCLGNRGTDRHMRCTDHDIGGGGASRPRPIAAVAGGPGRKAPSPTRS